MLQVGGRETKPNKQQLHELNILQYMYITLHDKNQYAIFTNAWIGLHEA